MCGRFALTDEKERIEGLFNTLIEMDYPPRYNIAPTQPVLVVRSPEAYRDKGDNRPIHDSQLARWGFIPSWTKEPDKWPLTINIRSETVFEKKSFRNALHYHRVIIPVSSFYEWKKKSTQTNQPFMVQRRDQAPFALAGLMETWSGAEGSQIDTVGILTKASTGDLRRIHQRMPVVIQNEDVASWLDCRNLRPSDVAGLLLRPADEELESFAISGKVNSIHNVGADIQTPIDLGNEVREKNDVGKTQLDLF